MEFPKNVKKPDYIVDLSKFREDGLYTAFLLALGAASGYFYYLTSAFATPESRAFPRIALTTTIFLVIIAILVKGTFLYEFVPTKEITKSEWEVGRIAMGFGWIVGYLMLIERVGFFTITAIFTFVIVLWLTDGTLKRKLIFASVTTLFLLGFTWVVFIEILFYTPLLRMGPLL